MFRRLPFICFTIYICIALMACQSNDAPPPLQSTPQPKPIKVIEPQQTVDLDLSKDFLDQVEASDRQAANLRQPETVTISSKEKREIKLGGGVAVDKEEKDLTQKIDGGEIT